MLELKNISKKLGDFSLENFSVEIQDGEYFVLLGPSGVGKTVLLETIAGLLPADKGEIIWKDRNITSVPSEERGFSMIYQDYALFPNMTVAGNMEYGLKMKKFPSGDIERKVNELAEKTGMTDLLSRTPETLSGGEKQRVAIARALATEPEVLLLDEPLSSLDSNIKLKLRKELKLLNKETKTTFIHVTHDLDEAVFLGDRIGVMLDGKLRQISTPDALFHSPSNVEVVDFVGFRNVLPIDEIKEEGVCRSGNLIIHASRANETKGFLWIKPEEIILSRENFASSALNQIGGKVEEWENSGRLINVKINADGTFLTSLITKDSFDKLEIAEGVEVFCTFKSSAVHCF